jgi:hypothetical protein
VYLLLILLLSAQELCEEEAYSEWKDDVKDTTPGKQTAIIQTLTFFAWLEQEDASEEED